MKKNNFDISSSGINLKLSCFLDGHQASHNYEENLTLVEDLLVFHGSTSFNAKDFEKTFDVTDNTKQLFKKYFNHIMVDDITSASYSDLKDFLEELYPHGFESFKTTPIKDLIEAIHTHLGSKKELDNFLSEHFKPMFNTVTVAGYSQGDTQTVYIPHEVTCELGVKADDLKEEIGNLIWDTPLSCKLTVDDEDIDLMEYIKVSHYKYEESEILKALDLASDNELRDYTVDEVKHIRSWLSENLPKHPTYID